MTERSSLPLSSPDVEGDDLLAWRSTFATVFAMPPTTAEEVDVARDTYRGQRLTGFRDDDRWVATFRSWSGDSAVPGPAVVGTAGSDEVRTLSTELVSSVAVAPTHRRRGLLRRLMTDCLDRATESGTVVASLFASEAAIYGRYGFGVATQVHDLVVDTRAAQRWHDGAPADPGRVRLSDDDELLEVGPALFEAARLRMPGAVARNPISWQRLLERPPAPKAEGPRVRAVHVDGEGRVDGYVRLRTEQAWSDGAPRYRATVDDLTGSSPAVAASLWRFALGMDLVTTLKAEHRSHGELLALLPQDTRAVRVQDTMDGHWWRVLDAPAALRTRTWAAPGTVVLEVVDPGGPAEGRWQLDADADGNATVTPSSASPDVTLPVQALPAVLTGVQDLVRLLAVGRLDEHRPGSVARLARMSHVSPVALAGVQGF